MESELSEFRVEYQDLIPALQEEEYRQLEANILRDGCRDPLVVWEDVLLDGHNRYKICQEHGLAFTTTDLAFESEDDAKVWMIKNQFGRRNLAPYQRAELSHLLEGLIPSHPGKNLGNNCDRGEEPLRKAAELANMSHNTYAKTKVIAEKADEDTKTKLRSGATSIDKVYKTINKKEKEKQRQEAKLLAISFSPALTSNRYSLYVGEFKDHPQPDVTVIITDPPYGKEHLELYSELSDHASFVLPPGGSCVVMTGQLYLEEVIRRLSEKLTYRWTCAYLTPGPSTRIYGGEVQTNWKPIIWLTKGEYTGKSLPGDVFTSPAPSKKMHEWGQSEAGMIEIVNKFTEEGDVVLDPMCGASTTGVACLALGRYYIGIDKDEGSIALSGKRLHAIRTDQ